MRHLEVTCNENETREVNLDTLPCWHFGLFLKLVCYDFWLKTSVNFWVTNCIIATIYIGKLIVMLLWKMKTLMSQILVIEKDINS